MENAPSSLVMCEADSLLVGKILSVQIFAWCFETPQVDRLAHRLSIGSCYCSSRSEASIPECIEWTNVITSSSTREQKTIRCSSLHDRVFSTRHYYSLLSTSDPSLASIPLPPIVASLTPSTHSNYFHS